MSAHQLFGVLFVYLFIFPIVDAMDADGCISVFEPSNLGTYFDLVAWRVVLCSDICI